MALRFFEYKFRVNAISNLNRSWWLEFVISMTFRFHKILLFTPHYGDTSCNLNVFPGGLFIFITFTIVSIPLTAAEHCKLFEKFIYIFSEVPARYKRGE